MTDYVRELHMIENIGEIDLPYTPGDKLAL